MDPDRNDLSSVPVDAVEDVKSSYVCAVCRAENALMYLGIQCCASCKMFFRRNADLNLNIHQCVFSGHCDLTMNTRGTCRSCRLQKCLSVGLEKDLIRSSHPLKKQDREKSKKRSSTNVSNEKRLSLPAVILPLDLLNNDRSLLTTVQWSLLSNVTHAYDDKSPASAIRDNMALQLAYPSKMRLKMATDYFKHITGALYLSAGPFMKTMPEFVNMSTDDQGVLVERNIRSMSGFSGILVMRETHICSDPYYHNASLAAYGCERTSQAAKIISHADIDGTLIKLMVPILALSTCSDILNLSGNDTIMKSGGTRLFSNTLRLLEVQNVYTEMLFKYMLYRYGYNEAALRFASLIKSCIDQNLMVSGNGDLRIHDQMVQRITEETELSLTLHDETI